jgi:hypothetical protein
VNFEGDGSSRNKLGTYKQAYQVLSKGKDIAIMKKATAQVF